MRIGRSGSGRETIRRLVGSQPVRTADANPSPTGSRPNRTLRVRWIAALLAIAACGDDIGVASNRQTALPEPIGVASGPTPTPEKSQGVQVAPSSGVVSLVRTGMSGGIPTRHAPRALASATGSKSFIVWQNFGSGERVLWEMAGGLYTGDQTGFSVGPDWDIAAVADFTGDGSADLLWQNVVTGERVIWQMSGTTYSDVQFALGRVGTDWSIAAVADFTGDHKPDIVWQNRTTGERTIWEMDGTTPTGSQAGFFVNPQWEIAAAADMNGDSHADLIWQNSVTGERAIWQMTGTTYSGVQTAFSVGKDWRIVAASDLDGNSNPDLVWENIATGQRTTWFMTGSAYSGNQSEFSVGTAWSIAAASADFGLIPTPPTDVPEVVDDSVQLALDPVFSGALAAPPPQAALQNRPFGVAWFYFRYVIEGNSQWYIVSPSGRVLRLAGSGSRYSGGIGWQPIHDHPDTPDFNGQPRNFQSVTVSSSGHQVSFGSRSSGSSTDPLISSLANTTHTVQWVYFMDKQPAGDAWFVAALDGSEVYFLDRADQTQVYWRPVHFGQFEGYPDGIKAFLSVTTSANRRSITFGTYIGMCGWNSPDSRDVIRAEYDRTDWFKPYNGIPYKPACSDLVTNASTPGFPWSELSAHLVHNLGGAPVGVFSAKMLAGISDLESKWGAQLTLTSTYRCPHWQDKIYDDKKIDPSKRALGSAHMYGQAADVGSTADTWYYLFSAAGKIAGATALDGVQDPSCSVDCVHVHWR